MNTIPASAGTCGPYSFNGTQPSLAQLWKADSGPAGAAAAQGSASSQKGALGRATAVFSVGLVRAPHPSKGFTSQSSSRAPNTQRCSKVVNPKLGGLGPPPLPGTQGGHGLPLGAGCHCCPRPSSDLAGGAPLGCPEMLRRRRGHPEGRVAGEQHCPGLHPLPGHPGHPALGHPEFWQLPLWDLVSLSVKWDCIKKKKCCLPHQ